MYAPNYLIMKSVKELTNLEQNSQYTPTRNINQSVEVIVIEDNQLTNMMMSKVLLSTINKIQKSKKIVINFSCFHLGHDFLNYFESKDFTHSKLIVFSDYFLEDKMTGGEILKIIKKKKADATVIIVSDIANPQIPVDLINMGAYRFIPKSNKAPVTCAELLFQKVG
jgi:DNA-binding NtrC family response regulator